MRAPLSWLREHVDLPADLSGRALGEALVPLGMEVETVDEVGSDITGPLVVGQVAGIEELKGFKKPIRWCHVDVGGSAPRGIVCGATNFAVGDRVVVALPGAVLPGDFTITARKTYGHVSDGMICSVRELGIGDDHTGILVLPSDLGTVGDDAVELLGLRDSVLDMAITPDRGYLECIRGLAREVPYAFDGTFRDPVTAVPTQAPDPAGWPVRIDDPSGCVRFSALRVTGLDPTRTAPSWMRIRLYRAGIRSVSLAVDVTNYVMLELGQPMHAYDSARVSGEMYARRARPGERLVTLDHTRRDLDPDDVVVADDTGAIGLAGVMGGLETEVSDASDDILLEAACWDPPSISRTVHRHKLPSEAAHRFERGVDPQIAAAALFRAAELLARYGGASVGSLSVAGRAYEPVTIPLPPMLPARTIGLPVDEVAVVRDLERVGCEVGAGEPLSVRPPSWRPDLTDPNDLVEEVARLEGYDRIPAVLPAAPPGRGLTNRQRFRRHLGTSLADAGYVEVRSFPFLGDADLDNLGLEAGDTRRDALRLVNPLSDEQPLLRTTLLTGLLVALRRNVGRGLVDVALYETGPVYRPVAERPDEAPRPPVDRRPSPEELALAESVLPEQPEHVAVVLCGDREPRGWWGAGRAAGWADAVEAMRTVAGAGGVTLDVRQGERAPWHPGRCAELRLGDRVVGHAGELHPRVVAALGVPERSCAAELDVSAFPVDEPAPIPAPRVSGYPPALLDVALTVDERTPVGEVEQALRDGAGELLESLRLFDVYAGAQVGEQRKSLAYALRLRAQDRTLTAAEATSARDAAVAEATRRTGAALRGT